MAQFAAAVVPFLQIAGTVLTAASFLGAGEAEADIGEARLAAAEREKEAREFEADQLETLAKQEFAASQREALEERRQANIQASRALAVAAASGAGAGDPTVIDIIANLQGEGAYRAGLALYEGEERQRLTQLEARERRFAGASALAEGQAELQAGKTRKRGRQFQAVSTIFSGASNFLLGKYGTPGKPPPASTSSASPGRIGRGVGSSRVRLFGGV